MKIQDHPDYCKSCDRLTSTTKGKCDRCGRVKQPTKETI